MTDRYEEMLEHLEYANGVVTGWPPWRRNILKYSSQPTCSIARKPVLHPDLVAEKDK